MVVKDLKSVLGGDKEASKLPFNPKLSPCCGKVLAHCSYFLDDQPHCTGMLTNARGHKMVCNKVYPRPWYKPTPEFLLDKKDWDEMRIEFRPLQRQEQDIETRRDLV